MIIGLVAGEISGDIIGAGLIRELRSKLSNVHFVGIGGSKMLSEGMESWYDMEELSVMGFFEVLVNLPRILYIRRMITKRFILLKLSVFIGIDAPEFNITLEKNLKDNGIPTIHYVSPSVWAWREKRLLKIRRATDNVLVFLPFEKLYYDKYNIPCQFIGHTLADLAPLDPDKSAARRQLGISVNARCLALLPGSRMSEMKRMSLDFLHCAELLSKHFSDLEVVIPVVHEKFINKFINFKSKNMSIHVLNNQSYQAMVAADVTLLASGTASLECMLAKCPMVVAYKMQTLTFILAKLLVNVSWISLPNLLAGRQLVKELLQKDCCPEKLATALIPLFSNDAHRTMLQKTFRQLHKIIRCNADKQAADAVINLINRC